MTPDPVRISGNQKIESAALDWVMELERAAGPGRTGVTWSPCDS